METILCLDIPVQMISCTDTNGKITPLRFRFRDKNGELTTVMIHQILKEHAECRAAGVTYTCLARLYGTPKTFDLRYSYYSHEWKLSRMHI